MRKLALACGIAMLLAVPTYGEAAYDRLIIDVPFPFFVGNTAMPPGEYTIRAVQPGIVDWHSGLPEGSFWTKSCLAAIVLTSPLERPADETQTASVVFTKYGADRYFVKDIWWHDAINGAHLPKSRTERELITSRLITQSRPATVTIIARRTN